MSATSKIRAKLQAFRNSPSIVKVLSAEQFLEGFTPIMAFQAIMFERAGGLNLQQIGLLFSVWWLAYLAAELPSGMLADYWSRKKVIMLGGLIRAAGFCVWLVWPSFWGYAIGFALWGMTIAFSSGSVTAYLENELRSQGIKDKFAKYFGMITAFYYTGILLSLGTAAVLTLRYTDVLIGLSIISSAAIVLLLWRMPEHPYTKQATYLKTLGAAMHELRRSKKLLYICAGLFTIYMIISVLEELLPRLYAAIGLSDTQIPLMAALALLTTVFAVGKLESFIQFSLSKQMLVMAGGLALLVGGLYVGGFTAVVGILLFNLVFQIFRPVFQHHVIHTAKGDAKATISSVPGLASGLFGAGAYGIIGLTAQNTSETFAIGIYGVFWMIVLLALAFIGRRFATPPISA
jgi:MFS family permease